MTDFEMDIEDEVEEIQEIEEENDDWILNIKDYKMNYFVDRLNKMNEFLDNEYFKANKTFETYEKFDAEDMKCDFNVLCNDHRYLINDSLCLQKLEETINQKIQYFSLQF